MARLKNNETTLSLAVSKSDSLRTTVPIYIIKKLNLKKGDRVEWDIDKVKGRWIATIKRSNTK